MFTKLSPGPGRPAAEVASHQRARLHSAMIELIAERGYSNVAVRDLASVAKVSTRAFYEQFGGKEDCFLRTHELLVRRTAKRVVAAQAGEHDWRGRLKLAFRALARELEREAQAARLALVDVYADGPAARAQARHAERIFEAMLADSFAHAPDRLPVAPLVVEGIVAGVAGELRRHVLAADSASAQTLGDDLLEWALACRERAMARVKTSPSPSSNAAMRSQSNPTDRDLILDAVAKLVTAKGRSCLTVPRIRAAAEVSRQRFDAEFDGVDDCLDAVTQDRLQKAFAHAAGMRETSTKGSGAAAAVLAACTDFARDPVLGQLCFTVDSAGPCCLPEYESKAIKRLTEAIYGEEAPNRPTVAKRAAAAMIWGVIGNRILADRSAALHRIAPTLMALVDIR